MVECNVRSLQKACLGGPFREPSEEGIGPERSIGVSYEAAFIGSIRRTAAPSWAG